ncbi:mCG1050980 [Mus musculus]|nr:mCG1050980 [Mus musculus]
MGWDLGLIKKGKRRKPAGCDHW